MNYSVTADKNENTSVASVTYLDNCMDASTVANARINVNDNEKMIHTKPVRLFVQLRSSFYS